MSEESDKGCVTGLLIDLSHPVSPRKAPAVDVEEDDDEFLTTIPNICSNQVFVGVNDVSFSLEKERSKGKKHEERAESSGDVEPESPPQLLDEELFDFDVPVWAIASDNESENNLSGVKSDDEEDEVFFGPVGHIEKCVAVGVSEVAKVHEKQRPLSPLTAAEMAELCREACTVASRIEIAAGVSCPTSEQHKDDEVFQLSKFEVELSKSGSDCLTKPASAVLPHFDLQSDENGVVQFSAAGQRLPTIAKPVVRKTGSGIIRPASVKNSLSLGSLNNATTLTKTAQSDLSSDVLTTVESSFAEPVGFTRKETISMKRQCISTTRDEGDISDTASVASDSSESSCINQITGKRCLPQPKFVRSSITSKLPQIGARSTSAAEDKGRIPVSQSQPSTRASSTGTETVTTPSLQRSISSCLKEPSMRRPAIDSQQLRLPRPAGRTQSMAGASTDGSSSTAEVSEKASGLRAPSAKPDLLAAGCVMPGCDKRKTLTAIRSLNLVGSTQRQGPLKAVVPSSNSTHSSASTAPLNSRGKCLPSATSTPCKSLQSDARLNSSLCTPSRSRVKPPIVTGSTLKRLSCVVTPGRLDSSFNMSRNDNGTPLRRRPSIDSARKHPPLPQTPVCNENALASLKQTKVSGFQLKSLESQVNALGAGRTALKSSNN